MAWESEFSHNKVVVRLKDSTEAWVNSCVHTAGFHQAVCQEIVRRGRGSLKRRALVGLGTRFVLIRFRWSCIGPDFDGR